MPCGFKSGAVRWRRYPDERTRARVDTQAAQGGDAMLGHYEVDVRACDTGDAVLKLRDDSRSLVTTGHGCRRDDSASSFAGTRAAYEIDQSADATDVFAAQHLGINLSEQVNFQRRVYGD